MRLPRFSMRPENTKVSFGDRNFDHFVFSEERGGTAASFDSVMYSPRRTVLGADDMPVKFGDSGGVMS